MESGISRSRLEINFIRLLDETQQIANGSKNKDWKFEKCLESRRLVILYGSETGTAQGVASRVARGARLHRFTPIISSMDQYIETYSIDRFLIEPLVIFIASTTGQGEDPGNMRSFFKYLWDMRRDRMLLSKLQFAVLGLGDSSYQKFNYAAKRLNNLLTYLGAKSIIKLGLADDQHDLGQEFVIGDWLRDFWGEIGRLYPLPDGVKPISSSILFPPKYKVVFVNDLEGKKDLLKSERDQSLQSEGLKLQSENNMEVDQNLLQSENNEVGLDQNTLQSERGLNQNLSASKSESVNIKSVYSAKITMNKRVTADDHFQDVRLIEFTDINECHKPGDVLMIQPRNLPEHTEEFIRLLGLDATREFYLETSDPNFEVPESNALRRPCTVQECVENYFDIQAVPQRHFFELLSHFTRDETEKEKYMEFCGVSGQQDLFNYTTRPKRSIMEVLADFPNTTPYIPFKYLFDLVPQIKPRPYSIASSSLAMPNRVQILVAVVEYKTNLKRKRLGLCTNFLSRLKLGDRVLAWIKPGTLKFPEIRTENHHNSKLNPKNSKLNSENPISSPENPNSSPENPNSSPKNPNSSPKNPNSSTENPNSSTENPNSSTENPNSSPKNPNSSPKNPNSSPENPNSSSESVNSNSENRPNAQAVIMIGPGTGCAPFRAYIQERVAIGATGSLVMVFGCRYSSKDYFFRDEWETMVKNKELELYCAFSRDMEDKVYVQHVIKENADRFWQVIGKDNAMVYFAGNAKRVPIDVYDALTYVAEVGLDKQGGNVDEYMKKSFAKRYQTETWA